MSTKEILETDPLASAHQRYMEAAKAADVETIVSLFCENDVLMPPNEPSLYGTAELKEWWEDYFEHFKIVALGETEREVTIMNGWVAERYGYMIAIAPVKGGERIRDDGRWFALWKLEDDGTWKMSQAMFNSIRPIGSGTSRFLARMAERKAAEGDGGK